MELPLPFRTAKGNKVHFQHFLTEMGATPFCQDLPYQQFTAEDREFIEGADMLRAVDVYTGRMIWQRELPGFGSYYNTTAHFAGAGEIGSNYVSLPDRIYAIHEGKILELDAATGGKVDRGWGTQIRSYVLYDNRVKDHRTGFEVGNPQTVLDGSIQGFIDAELLRRRAEREKSG